MNNKNNLIVGILVGIAITTVGFAVFSQRESPEAIMTQKSPTITPMPTQYSNPTVTGSVTVTEPSNGIIEGSLSYPSESIPEALQVCALNTLTQETLCTSDHISNKQFSSGLGFSISVVPGSYVVYANLPGSTYRAYYSESVTCGLTIECTDHTPIVLKIKSGDTATAEPGDWYDTTQQ